MGTATSRLCLVPARQSGGQGAVYVVIAVDPWGLIVWPGREYDQIHRKIYLSARPLVPAPVNVIRWAECSDRRPVFFTPEADKVNAAHLGKLRTH